MDELTMMKVVNLILWDDMVVRLGKELHELYDTLDWAVDICLEIWQWDRL